MRDCADRSADESFCSNRYGVLIRHSHRHTYTYIYAYIYVYTYIYTYIYTHTYIYTYTYVYANGQDPYAHAHPHAGAADLDSAAYRSAHHADLGGSAGADKIRELWRGRRQRFQNLL